MKFLIIAVAAISLVPTLLVDIPAMSDYLDHLARMYVLTDVGTPKENPYYEIRFGLYPNLAMDLIVPQLARMVDVESATKYFFFCAQILVVTGAVAIEWALKRRHQLAIFASLLALQSIPFAYGLVNFEWAVGVALFGIASWIVCEKGKGYTRFAGHIVFVVVLFLGHFFALGIYGLVLGILELRKMFLDPFDLKGAAMTVVMLAAPVLALLVILYATGGAIGAGGIEWEFRLKPLWLALSLNGYNILLSAGSVAVLMVLLSYLAVKRSLVLSSPGTWISIGFVLVFIILPSTLFGSRMADVRIITAALLILPAFLIVQAPKQPVFVAGFIVSILITLNAGYAAHIWLSYRADYAEIKASFTLLKPGALVLVGDSRTGEVASTLLADAPMFRAPALAVHYAKAFVSSLYTIPGAQPVEVRSNLQHLDVSIATESYALPSLTVLRAIEAGHNVTGVPGYLRNWDRDFEYVYLIGPPIQNAIPGVLAELYTSPRFTLYIVRYKS